MSGHDEVTLFLCGDVMIGRGIDQVLPHSCPPHLYEPVVTSALEYVALAEERSGPLPRPVEPEYVWGDALGVLEARAVDARVVNLETSVTTSEDALPKGINYRMHPGNVSVLEAAALDCCVLANNHVLDWGEAGLEETLETLEGAGIAVTGAGRDLREASAPAVLELPGGRRLLVYAFAATDSGVPLQWGAAPGCPGVHVLPDLSDEAVEGVAGLVRETRSEGDLVVGSIHWGANWGYGVPGDHRRFARALVERAGIDVVHGHSSHHPKGIEVHAGRLILYGCGDFLNDYEGIGGYEDFRGDLVLMYLPVLDAGGGGLLRLEMVPLVVRRFRLNRPGAADREWLARRLDRECRRLGSRVSSRDGVLVLEWSG